MTSTLQKFDLTGHVSVVTGGNRGIGLGIAVGLARAGARISVWGRDEENNRAAEEVLRAEGVDAIAVECDVSDHEQVDRATRVTVERFGGVDSCFAVAGVNSQTPFVDTTLEEFRRVVGVNLEGTFLTFQAVARHMVDRGSGSLVAVSSISAHSGQPRSVHYAASKAGIGALAKSLAVELARYGVRANTVVPGWIETDMIAPFLADEKFVDRVIRRIPQRRWGRPEDLAGLAVFLAGPASGYVTGAEFVVDGGYTLF
ncbi:SDR family NAD(P)-dependent oxidoreductase [Saccharothrix variisporea]|uniref:NAD(P)-dependent dehydrogenase (Short-subunit alcohol dehydrogenase family) n=1 Tax=Saccharothrix variisporea TaxID=543527 RepID=A0A495XJ69_9PSEU|nr:SDR family NAD(P)-dependent oxidoreductase [Saccharothrix variisporea]RKT74430.1 NAD(P)-dependent dehydrogenase (short-subunit alcohol dehydrogenase family) [Saccharothrix variisporea]